MADTDKNIVDLPDRQSVREQASLWIARLESRDDNPAVINELQDWLNTSQLHRDEFRRLSALWGDMDILDELNYLEDTAPGTNKRSGFRALHGLIGAVAALALTAIVSFTLYYAAPDEAELTTLSTAFGEVDTVTLSDGSTVTLNTDSLVEVAMTADERRLTLVRGEAHFAVAKDAARPFTVHAGTGLVRAVGTAFSVYLKERDVEVTVSEGRVELMTRESETSTSAPDETAAEPKLLRVIAAGDHAVIGDENLKRLEPISEIAINRKLSWRSGMLAFAGEPLSDVLAQVSRYTDVKVVVVDDAVAALPVGGYFKVGELDGLLEALETTFGVRAEWVDEKHVRITQSS